MKNTERAAPLADATDRARSYQAARHAVDDKAVDDLTHQNVKSIAALEAAAKISTGWGERLAMRIAGFCGSMLFIYIHLAWFSAWIFFNVSPIFANHPDPFPFFFLTTIVTLELFFLSAFILISQNQETKITEKRSHLNLQINMLTEQENTKMLKMLSQISVKLGVDQDHDSDLAALAGSTKHEKLFDQIESAHNPAAKEK
jgi:uncharacterized membrane protein